MTDKIRKTEDDRRISEIITDVEGEVDPAR